MISEIERVDAMHITLGSSHRLASVQSVPTIGFAWLVRLRWIVVGTQLVALVIARQLLHVEISPVKFMSVTGIVALTNFILSKPQIQRSPHSSLWMACALVLDTALLTLLLAMTGGASNPFSAFYIVQVALAALLLEARALLAVTFCTCLAFASLFMMSPADSGHAHHGAHPFASHLHGMWIAYVLAAGFIAYFVSRLARALQQRERELAELQEHAARIEKIAALSAVVAEAAHELGTPLGTIAVIAQDLANAQNEFDASSVIEDAKLLRSEAERCRTILSRMHLAEIQGEALAHVDVETIFCELRSMLGEEQSQQLITQFHGSPATIRVPLRALVQCLVNLVRNSFDAIKTKASRGSVTLSIEEKGQFLCFSVRDDGEGMPRAVLGRIGEPFFSTKTKEHGMGLGLFLAQRFAEQVHGTLRISSAPGSGTDATLYIPRSAE